MSQRLRSTGNIQTLQTIYTLTYLPEEYVFLPASPNCAFPCFFASLTINKERHSYGGSSELSVGQVRHPEKQLVFQRYSLVFSGSLEELVFFGDVQRM